MHFAVLPQAEAAAPVAIALGQDFEDFEFANDMFTYDPLAGEEAIPKLVRGTQLPAARFFLRCTTLGVSFLQPLIAPIAQALN